MANDKEKLEKLLRKKEQTERLLCEIKTEIATTESKISGDKYLNYVNDIRQRYNI